MLQNAKIGLRLSLGFGLVLALMVAILVTGIVSMGAMNSMVDKMVTKDWVKTELANNIIDLANANMRASYEMVIGHDARATREQNAVMKENRKKIAEYLDKLEPIVLLPKGRELLGKVKEARQNYIGPGNRVVDLCEAGQYDKAAEVMSNDVAPALNAYVGSLNAFITFQGSVLEDTGKAAVQRYESSRNLVVTLGVIAGLLGLAFAWWITRSITAPLNQAVHVANSLAGGDLTVSIDSTSKDETGLLLEAMREMVGKLSNIISEVRGSADSLSSASEEVSATAQSLSQAASEQAASVEEINATIDQASLSISQNAENAKITEGIASTAAREATEGGEAVKETVSAMKSIAAKIGIIDDIAYQTNLLALNAAIEAARAGEHGKGFAVVAAEVRKLAERSQVAAQEIGELAGGSVELAEKAGKLLAEMVPSINKTSDLVQEITAASREQSSGMAELTSSMGQMSQVTQQNASASEELAATAEEMSSQAEQLQQVMSFFKMHGSMAAGRTASRRVPQSQPQSRLALMPAHRGDSGAADEADFVRF